ncbi:MAG: 50S ribosomal protein L24 [Chloroflexi bacterium]|nr:50S ribosomal protein L24 [Chloroflexota bacterium]MCI0770363.1 50S ribosomal protein L24 [Chloroflexota bacterium]MCI0812332.1 50S ribosomal protein L24 [Chloroflexota bacterium]MCI0886603.1 50S ribosomal protein L24 [Chloroflexota bacterium]
MKLHAEDNVMVIKGRDRGKQGRITRVFRKEDRVLVEGVNLVTRHTKSTGGVRQAGIIKKEMPVKVCNVMLVCPGCGKPTRIGYRSLADGSKARVCKKCEEVIE